MMKNKKLKLTSLLLVSSMLVMCIPAYSIDIESPAGAISYQNDMIDISTPNAQSIEETVGHLWTIHNTSNESATSLNSPASRVENKMSDAIPIYRTSESGLVRQALSYYLIFNGSNIVGIAEASVDNPGAISVGENFAPALNEIVLSKKLKNVVAFIYDAGCLYVYDGTSLELLREGPAYGDQEIGYALILQGANSTIRLAEANSLQAGATRLPKRRPIIANAVSSDNISLRIP